jgi:nucleoside 2-deoxyribosyltransferase
MGKIKVYLAGPLGFSEAGKAFMNDRLIPLLEAAGVEVLNPWASTVLDEILKLPYGEKKRRLLEEGP